jgi:hypothetical protein
MRRQMWRHIGAAGQEGIQTRLEAGQAAANTRKIF